MATERDLLAKRAAWMSLVSNVILTALKLVIGIMAGSQALFAEGVHSASDILASVTALLAMRVSTKPPDEDHPYGHGKAEVMSSTAIALILIAVSIWIAVGSIRSLYNPIEPPHLIAIFIAAFSYLLKNFLYRYTLKLANQWDSKALMAIAVDHKSDILASLAAVIGIGIAIFGKWAHIPILAYADPLAGIVVSLFIIKIALELGIESFHILMERNVSAEQMEIYAELVKSIPEVRRIDRLRARDHGHYVLIDLRISIDADLTIKQGHDIIRKIKSRIMEQEKRVGEVLIHLNPFFDGE